MFGNHTNQKAYRTQKRAGTVSSMPKSIALIINPDYANSFGFVQKGNAHLLIPEQGVPQNLDLIFLQLCYSIFLYNYGINVTELDLNAVLRIYYPDYARAIGKSDHMSKLDIESFVNKILAYKSVRGFIDGNVLPVLVYEGRDESTNTYEISSPYMVAVMQSLARKKKMEKEICTVH